MSKWSVIQYNGFQDFKYGSFTIYATESELVIRGILKKTNNYGLYMMIRKGFE